MVRSHREKQLALPLRTHGGARRGAGRKPAGARPGVAHVRRPAVTGSRPVHVTLRAQNHVWNLRSRRCFRVIVHALAMTRDASQLRVVHFSVQGNHLHLVCETRSAEALAAAYVLGNFASHARRRGERVPDGWADPYSSTGLVAGRPVAPGFLHTDHPLDVVSPPRSWLLRRGVRQGGAGGDQPALRTGVRD